MIQKRQWSSLPDAGLAAAVGAYALVLVSLSGARPFWLDELLQLLGTRDLPIRALSDYVATFPGAAPLGYFAQHWAIALLGFSPFSARLSSEVFSVFSCAVLPLLCRLLRIRNAWFPLICWMLLPLQLRYALEGRPYAQGLFFSVAGTLCFFAFFSRPCIVNAVAYTAILVLGIYSAPYTLFLQLGYIVCAVVLHEDLSKRLLTAATFAVSGLSFLPWYIGSKAHWTATLASTPDVAFNVSPKFILLPIKEISGGGYVCSVSLIVLAIIGCRSPHIKRAFKSCLVAGTVSGIACVLLADVVFGYFFAVRQIIFILVPLILLAGAGFSLLVEQKRWVLTVFLGSLLLAGSIVKDARYFSDHSEDWKSGAALLESARNEGACLRSVTGDDPRPYLFYYPSFLSDLCPSLAGQELVALPFTRYTAAANLQKDQEALLGNGYKLASTMQAGGTTLQIYSVVR